MEIIVPLQGHIVSFSYSGISHYRGTRSRLSLYPGALGVKGPGVVGAELVPHFVGYEIQVEAVSFGGRGGRIGASLAGIVANGTDKPCIPRFGTLVEQMTDVVARRTDLRIKGALYLRTEISTERVGSRIRIDYLIRIGNQLQADGQVCFKDFIDPRKGCIDAAQGTGNRPTVVIGVFPCSGHSKAIGPQQLVVHQFSGLHSSGLL